MRLIVILLASSIAASNLAFAAFDDYPTRAISSLLSELAPTDKDEYLRNPGSMYLEQGGNTAARARVTYLGQARPITSERRALLQTFFKTQQRPEVAELFKDEILCSEGRTKYWLPIQSSMLSHWHKEVSKNTDVDLFVLFIGSYRAESKELVHVVVVNEFAVPKGVK